MNVFERVYGVQEGEAQEGDTRTSLLVEFASDGIAIYLQQNKRALLLGSIMEMNFHVGHDRDPEGELIFKAVDDDPERAEIMACITEAAPWITMKEKV